MNLRKFITLLFLIPILGLNTAFTEKARPNNVVDDKVELLPRLLNKVEVKNVGSDIQVWVSLHMTSDMFLFVYKKTGNSILLKSVDHLYSSDINHKTSVSKSDFLSNGLVNHEVNRQKANATPLNGSSTATVFSSIRALLQTALKKQIKGTLSADRTGRGTVWYDDRVFVGNVTEGVPVGQGVMFSFDNKVIYRGAMRMGIYDGQGISYEGRNSYEGTFFMGQRDGLFKVTEYSEREGTSVSTGKYDFQKRIGLWHRVNANGSIEEITYGDRIGDGSEKGGFISSSYVQFANPDFTAKTADEVIKSLEKHLYQVNLDYVMAEKNFIIGSNNNKVTDYDMNKNSFEVFLVILEKGSVLKPVLKLSRVNEPKTAFDLELKKHEGYSKGYGRPVFMATFMSEGKDVSFDILLEGDNKTKGSLFMLDCKQSAYQSEPKTCTHGFVK